MSDATRKMIRHEVLSYVEEHGPARIGTLTESVQKKHMDVRESEVLTVVQPMIVTGKLSYASDLKIKLGGSKTE